MFGKFKLKNVESKFLFYQTDSFLFKITRSLQTRADVLWCLERKMGSEHGKLLLILMLILSEKLAMKQSQWTMK
jgi:hypothetical protein